MTVEPLSEEQRRLVEENLPLVAWVLTRKMNRRRSQDDWDDVHQDGVLGLMHAARKFEPERGWKFNTYAVRCIWGFVMKGHRFRWGDPERPLIRPSSSLDAPLPGFDGESILAVLADPDAEFEDVLLDRAEELHWAGRLREVFASRPELIEAFEATLVRGGAVALAKQLGVSSQTVRNRAEIALGVLEGRRDLPAYSLDVTCTEPRSCSRCTVTYDAVVNRPGRPSSLCPDCRHTHPRKEIAA